MTAIDDDAASGGKAVPTLRARAEQLLGASTGRQAPAADEGLRLLHELQVHHIELHLQNDELEAARAEAVLARDRYARLFNRVPVSALELGGDGRIIEANAAAALLLRSPQEALAGRGFGDLVAPASRPAWVGLLAAAASGGVPRATLRLDAAEPPERSVQADLAVDAPGRSLLLTLTDLSEREHTLALQTRAAWALEQAGRLENEILSRMNHELRTPLNVVLGCAQLGLRDANHPLDSKNRQRTERIRRAGEELLSVIESSLDAAQIEAGRLFLRIEPVDLVALVDDGLARIAPRLAMQELRLVRQAPPAAGCRVLADPQRLQQVLTKLLVNAAKYNRPGGELRVDWRADRPPGQVSLVVTDTGLGLSRSQQQRLFRPLDRGARGAAATRGPGLGLVVTRLLVEAMGGALSLDSQVGRGTAVSVTLPAAPLPAGG